MKRAFTLIELLVVIAIIGLLSTIAVVSLTTARSKARLAVGQQSDVNIYQGLGDRIVGDWGLDETSGTTIIDASGNGNNGTLGGTINGSTYTTGIFGNAIYFNGTHIDTANSLTVSLNSFTSSLWLKTTSTGAYQWIFSPGSGNGGQPIGTDNSGKLRMCDTVNCYTGTRKFNDGNWHFVVVTGDSTSIKGYVDGALEFTTGPSASVINHVFTIGADNSSGVNGFVGTLDQVRLYSGATTAQAIQKLYAEGIPHHLARNEQ